MLYYILKSDADICFPKGMDPCLPGELLSGYTQGTEFSIKHNDSLQTITTHIALKSL